jgi:hypothetical protein
MSPLDVFYKAVYAFNIRNWFGVDGLYSLLDDHVIAHAVHGGSPVTDKDPVIQYLIKDVFYQDPHFILNGPPTVNGADVSGSACWTDPSPVKVNYKFTIVNDKIKQMKAPEAGPCA